MSVLKVDGLVKSFGRRKVVNGVSFEIAEGELVGLLGPNGAGKTTCFGMTCGLLAPDSGKVYLNGENVTAWPMYRRAKDGQMGYLPQQSSVFSKLTTQQNLLAMMELLGMPWRLRKERCAELLDEFEITGIRKSRAGSLSGGERRRLEIARCLVSDPKIIMLDEPFAGIDPVTVQSIQKIIRRLCDEGIAILITDHAAREILQITERTYVVSDGQILCSGSAQEIIKHPEVKEKYLGEIDGIQTGGPGPVGRPTRTPKKIMMETNLDEDSESEDFKPGSIPDNETNPSKTPVPGPANRKVVATRQTLLRKSDLD